ncbi:hypothetical protein ABPG72_000643 [Tetrahymena utriculariae]
MHNHKLEGFNRIDFSSVKNYTLTLSTKNYIISNIYLFAYQCQEKYMCKNFVPKNCANQSDKNYMINNPYASLRLKLYTSQQNTSSQQPQSGYRNSYVYLQGDQFQFYSFKAQKQATYLKKGAIVQEETSFSAPIQYEVQNFNFNRQAFIQKANQISLMQINVEMDETIQHIQIQYSNFPEIFAQCNSAFAFLMCLGFFGKMQIGEQKDDDQVQKDNFQSIFIPSFDAKSIKLADRADSSMNKIQNKILGLHSKIQNQIAFQRNESENNFSQNQFLDYKQKAKQRKINAINSPIKIKSKINFDQFQNNIEISTLKSQEMSQEKFFLPQTKINSLKKTQSANQENLQNQIKADHSQNILQISSYYNKVLESIQNNSLMKQIKVIISKARFFRKREYFKYKELDPIHKSIVEDQVTVRLLNN